MSGMHGEAQEVAAPVALCTARFRHRVRLRKYVTSIVAATFLVGATAWSAQSNRVRAIPAPVRSAGTFHVPTGTWTRALASVSAGDPVIYSNDCGVSALMLMGGQETWTDEGRLPSLSSPSNSSSKPGTGASYRITGFDMSYCTSASSTVLVVEFRDRYLECTDPLAWGSPSSSITLNNLPGAQPGAQAACWTVTIDLGSPPEPGEQSFVMLADGDGAWSPTTPLDPNTFGVSVRMPTAPSQSTSDGMIAANETCSRFGGTIWDPSNDPSRPGTGMGTEYQIRVDGPQYTYCYGPSTIPLASFWLRLRSSEAGTQSGDGFCFGDGSGTSCPCGNPVALYEGCGNSTSGSGWLTSWGAASVTADTLTLQAAGLPSSAPALFFQGTAVVGGGAGAHFGDGLMCVGGGIVRIGTLSSANGNCRYPESGGVPVSVRGAVPAVGGLRHYQAWYRNAAAFCTQSPFNLTNGHSVTWMP